MPKVVEVSTKPYDDQKMGTSGLRKKVKVYQQKNYIENFIQSVFNIYSPEEYKGKTLIIGGDGRFYNDVAIQLTIKIASANGVGKIVLAEKGLMSTPAVSLLIRSQPKGTCYGGFIFTASHNPGGENADMGIKFNGDNGAAIPEGKNNAIYDASKKIDKYLILDTNETFSLEKNYDIEVIDLDNDSKRTVKVEIESTTKLYMNEMKNLFDFNLIQKLFKRNDFKFIFDGLHGISGPYAIELFHKTFGVPMENLDKCNPLPDFGGLHPDPNLVHAKDLVKKMGVGKKQSNGIFMQLLPSVVVFLVALALSSVKVALVVFVPVVLLCYFVDLTSFFSKSGSLPDFGAACDGDADRNIIFGPGMLVSPSDSLAVLANNSNLVKSLVRNGPLKGVARSMPTSGAVDRVAKKKGLDCYEVPTGWKFFGNLLDAGRITLCGEESFGTGSDHAREKDGLWAVLCWLSILAEKNKDNKGKFIGIPDIMAEHWKCYGRDYYCRYDYEDLNGEQAAKVKENLTNNLKTWKTMKEGNEACIFEYNDPVDKSTSKNQGWIFKFKNGSRIIFRFSGTSSANATVRVYFEKHEEPEGNLFADVADVIKKGENFPELAVKLSDIHNVAGRTGPTVIT